MAERWQWRNPWNGNGMDDEREQGAPGKSNRFLTLQLVVFSLVCAAFTTIYITQPVLPVLREEFGVDATTASYTIAAVVLGIALSNLPFGLLSD
jgi:MFS family permease